MAAEPLPSLSLFTKLFVWFRGIAPMYMQLQFWDTRDLKAFASTCDLDVMAVEEVRLKMRQGNRKWSILFF
jgi:hypothetical protein